MNVVNIGVSSLSSAKARLAQAMRGKVRPAGSRIDFVSPELLRRVLAPNRLEIIRSMCGAGPFAPREIARRVGRDVKGVHTDVHALLAAGMIDGTDEGFVFPFTSIHVDFTVDAAA